MPVVAYDPRAASRPIRETVHVWESLGRYGDYALCTKPEPLLPHPSDWRYRGPLLGVAELSGFPRAIILRGVLNGWPMIIHRDPDGNYSF
jgi:hypothetical protein